MSFHLASLLSFILLSVSIILTSVSVTLPWWSGGDGAGEWKSDGDVTLWSIEFSQTKQPNAILRKRGKLDWNALCDFPTLEGPAKNACAKITAMRAFLILAALFAFFAASGVAYGLYSGNTLVSSISGVIAGFSLLMTLVAIGLAYMTETEGLSSSIGHILSCVTGALELIGSFLCCVGTCQEMRELTAIAASLNLGPKKVDTNPKSRAEKSAAIRETEAAEAAEIHQNLMKRYRKEQLVQPMPESVVSTDVEGGKVEEEEAPKKKVPIHLKRILFRKPTDDDDEIPTQMIEDAFAEIDGDGSGSIDVEELVDALQRCDLPVSQVACDTVMKEIDKNASGDIDLREFIEFFRHIEDLNRFQKKSAARQQFLTFLLNFCFLADIVVVGVMLMMFIRMEKADNPDFYSIMKNVLLACSALLGILFLMVILLPIMRLAFGPTIGKMQMQYEIAQEIKKMQRKNPDEQPEQGPREPGFGPDDPPPPVNAAMFGRSYRPGRVDAPAWTQQIEDEPSLKPASAAGRSKTSVGGTTAYTYGTATTGSDHASSHGHRSSATSVSLGGDHSHGHGSHGHGHHGGGGGGGGGGHHRSKSGWRYDPSNYADASAYSYMQEAQNMVPTTWSPMQVKENNMPINTRPATLPGVPPALTDAAFPHQYQN